MPCPRQERHYYRDVLASSSCNKCIHTVYPRQVHERLWEHPLHKKVHPILIRCQTLGLPNIELSCAAASPARSEPQRRHSYEKEDHLRRQLQRFVRLFLASKRTIGLNRDLTNQTFAKATIWADKEGYQAINIRFAKTDAECVLFCYFPSMIIVHHLGSDNVPLLRDMLTLFGQAFDDLESYRSDRPSNTYLRS